MIQRTGLIFTILFAAVALASHASAGSHGDGHKSDKKDKKDYPCKMDKRGKHFSVEAMDADDNGTVSLKEFIAAHEERLKKKFAKIDSDGDGELSEEEIEAKRKKMKKHMMERRGGHMMDDMHDDDDMKEKDDE